MAFRSCVWASLLLALAGASKAPGCGCQVSHCCKAFNSSQALADIFNDSMPSYSSEGLTVFADREGYSPACSLLNLVPGIFDESGDCSDFALNLTNSSENTVCELIANYNWFRAAAAKADGEEFTDPLGAGRPILSTFVEPGTCAELQGSDQLSELLGTCWESREGAATYQWDGLATTGDWSSWCTGLVAVATPALASSLTCHREGAGLVIKAKWVDGNATDANATDSNNTCSMDYSGGLEATIGAEDWNPGDWAAGSPRWQCFDIPRGNIGPSDHRVFAYSIGDLPCVAGATTTTDHAPISGSSGKSLAVLAHAAVGAVAAGSFLI